LPGHAAGKSAPCFENLLASNIELFLQRCKNGLGSPKVVHVILKRQFKDLFKQLLSIHHIIFPPEKNSFPLIMILST
jgi:hypothetical protein